MVDGLLNSVVESDIVSSPYETGSPENFAGNAFTATREIISKAKEGARMYNAEADRRWTIVNEGRKHPASGKEVGYSIGGMKGASVKLMAKPDSWVAKRAVFATKDLWVVRNEERREFPAGKYLPQT